MGGKNKVTDMAKELNRSKQWRPRKSQKHSTSVVSRTEIMALLTQQKPLAFQAIVTHFNYSLEAQTEGLRRRLRAMVRDGQLECDIQGRYFPVSVADLCEAIVEFDEKGRPCVFIRDTQAFIPARQLHRIFPGDLVRFKLEKSDYRRSHTAVIVDVIAHNTHTLIGRYSRDPEHGGIVVTQDARWSQEIIVPDAANNQARYGQLVVVEITDYPDRNVLPKGRVIQVIGDKLPVHLIVNDMIALHQLPHEWPNTVTTAVSQLPAAVGEFDANARQDVRELPLITIDGEDAKDFDDAVYCTAVKGGWHLLVAIADVSHYVGMNTALDDEAYQRGTSVYFPDRVVPMLPEVLSNGLCSLKPKVDRLCLVCDMQVSSKGQCRHYQFYPAIMHSHARLTYDQVNDFLTQATALPIDKPHIKIVTDSLQHLQALTHACLEQRTQRGALDFDVPDTKILMNTEGYVTQVVNTQQNFANRLIEECMLLANTSAANLLQQSQQPCLYRVHSGLKEQAGTDLQSFLSLRGLSAGNMADPDSKALNTLIKQVKERPDYHIIQMMLLRSLNRALYSADNIGHFGLAYDAYTHFTSPIRRYPDLIVHRTIKRLLNRKDRSGHAYDLDRLNHLGEHTSNLERRAEGACRDAISMLKCVYMEDKLGKEYDGVVSGVMNFGFFVTIVDLLVDGLVHVNFLNDDFYQFDNKSQMLVGTRTGRRFKLGQTLRIQVTRVNVSERKIDFQLVKD